MRSRKILCAVVMLALVAAMLPAMVTATNGDANSGGYAGANANVNSGGDASANANSYSDVDADTQYHTAIEYLSELGVIDGYPDGTFRPGVEITRAEFCKVIMMSLGKLDYSTRFPEDTTSFSDIDVHWAKDYIDNAAKRGYVNGIGDGLFAPDENITCEQAITIVVRIVSGNKASYPLDYLTYAMREEISSGVAAVTGRPITRGEAAQIIYNVLEKRRFAELEDEILGDMASSSPSPIVPPGGSSLNVPDASVEPAPGGTLEAVPDESVPFASGNADYNYSNDIYPVDPWIPWYPGNYNTEEYLSNRENAFESPLTAPLSTFSLDVNTASYGIVRRNLQNGRVPDGGAIKIEELVNYFEYDLERPTGGEPFAVTTEAQVCPWNEDNYLAMIALQGYDIDKADLPPSNLVFLIDISGSMYPADRLPLVQRAMSLLVDELREEDTVSIVVYASWTGVALEATSGAEKETIRSAIFGLRAGGSTYGAGGIQLAYEQARMNFIEGGNNRVILCTDGDFNVGISSVSALEDLIVEQRESGVFLSVLGFGMGNVKDNKMETLAIRGNGNYAYIDNLKEAKKVLVDDMTSTIFAIAKDVKLQVEFNPETVAAYRLIGYEKRLLNTEDFADDSKDAGEMGAGHSMVAFYEIIPRGSGNWEDDDLKYQTSTTTGSDDLLTVELRYKAPDSDVSVLMEPFVLPGLSEEPPSETFAFASAVVEWGLILSGSDYKADASFDSVIERAFANRGSDIFGYRAEFVQLVDLSRFVIK